MLGKITLYRMGDRIDAVVHAAAQVSLLRGAASLRAVNVDATAALLELAAHAGAFFHHLSTLSVAPPGQAEVPEAFLSDQPVPVGGYARSKRAAEQLIAQAAERGLPVAVHRIGRVTGARATGIVNPQDILWRILRAGIPAGVLPALHNTEVWSPVDELACDLAELVTIAPAPGTVLNHATQPPVSLSQVHSWVHEYGYPIDVEPLPSWSAALVRRGSDPETTAVLALLDGLPATGEHNELPSLGPIHADSVHRLLGERGTAVQPVDGVLVHRYLDHCVRTGLLPAPPARVNSPSGAGNPTAS